MEKALSKFSNCFILSVESGGIKVHFFDHVDRLFEDITTNNTRKYCFAFELSDVHPNVEEVNVTILFPRDDIGGIINSEKPLYDLT